MHVTIHVMKLPRHTMEITLASIIILCLAWVWRQFYKRHTMPMAMPVQSVDTDNMKSAAAIIDVPVQVMRMENPITASDTNHAVSTGGNYRSR